jgi:RHS repeat-associated protein
LDGEVVQHIEYVPFGEVFIEERNNTWNTPYLFNAKELDGETGLYYYGARYYDPRVSIWLSVDPLQEKYPNVSTYAYTFHNPIKYIDPNGKDPITGVIEALTGFGIDVGMDFISGWILEGKTAQEAFDDIGWWSAGFSAAGTYLVASVTPSGTATGLKIAKIAKSKPGQIVMSIVSKMTTKALDNFSKGKYDDDEGNFDFDKVNIGGLFWESAIETLLDMGFKGKTEEIMNTLKNENKKLYEKLNKLYNKVESGESTKRINNYTKVVENQRERRNDALRNAIVTGTEEKALKEGASKVVNEYTNPFKE